MNKQQLSRKIKNFEKWKFLFRQLETDVFVYFISGILFVCTINLFISTFKVYFLNLCDFTFPKYKTSMLQNFLLANYYQILLFIAIKGKLRIAASLHTRGNAFKLHMKYNYMYLVDSQSRTENSKEMFAGLFTAG